MAFLNLLRKGWFVIVLSFFLYCILPLIPTFVWIHTGAQSKILALSLIFSIPLLLLLTIPEVWILSIVGGILFGALPGPRIDDSINNIVLTVKRFVTFAAFLGSFVLLVAATWPWHRNWPAALMAMTAGAALGLHAIVFRPESKWFQNISLWYSIGILVIALLFGVFSPFLQQNPETKEVISQIEQSIERSVDRETAKQLAVIQTIVSKNPGKTIEELAQEGKLSKEQLTVWQKADRMASFRSPGDAAKNAVEVIASGKTNDWFPLIMTIAGLVALIWLLKKAGKGTVKILVVFGLLAGSFFAYRKWDSVEKGIWDTKGFANNAVVYSVSLDSIRERRLNVENINPGYYRFQIYPSIKQYAFSCANGGSGFGNPIPAGEEIAESDRSYGNILLRGSGTVASDAQPSGGNLILVQDDKDVILSFNFPQEKKALVEGCPIIGGLKVEFQFIKS